MTTQRMGPNAIAGVILAGGRSTRFGSDKASALLAGRPMLVWVASALAEACDEIVIVRAAGQTLPALDGIAATVVDDFAPAEGPLIGAIAGLRAAKRDRCFLTSCDAPLLRPALVRCLAEALDETAVEAACPLLDGSQQPLVAAYDREAALAHCEAAYNAGERSLRQALARMTVRWVERAELLAPDPKLASFRNANTPAGLASLERDLAAAERPS